MLFSGYDFQPDLTVVLVGQERTGKSSAGNTILGKRLFNCKISANPVTLKSEKREGYVRNLRVSVVDTPGLFSTQLSQQKVRSQLIRAVDLSFPGPHVFLLTIQLGRFTEEEEKGPETLQKMLSGGVCKYTMVLFTYGDRLEDTNMDQFIKEDHNLQELLNKCSGLWHVFNNKDMGNRDQVRELFDKIDCLSKGRSSFYERSSVATHSFFSAVTEPLKQLFKSNSVASYPAASKPPVLQTYMERNTDVESETKAEWETKVQSETKVEKDREIESQTKVERDREIESQRKDESETKIERDREIESQANDENQTKVERDREIENDPKAEYDIKTESETKEDSEAKLKSGTNGERDTEVVSQTNEERDRKAESETRLDSETKEKRATKVESETKQENETEVESEMKLDRNIKVGSETKEDSETKRNQEGEVRKKKHRVRKEDKR